MHFRSGQSIGNKWLRFKLDPNHHQHNAESNMCLLRFIAKLRAKITELDSLHNDVNTVYSSGAVEGYTKQPLNSKTDFVLTLLCAALWCPNIFDFSMASSFNNPKPGMKLNSGTCTRRLPKRVLDWIKQKKHLANLGHA